MSGSSNTGKHIMNKLLESDLPEDHDEAVKQLVKEIKALSINEYLLLVKAITIFNQDFQNLRI